ncbi:MAG TPA: hypothetical protein PK874_12665 [Desulfobacteraceae bacterium]|nr:hypothetical protein [Desulfobacteraceae bacterium]HPQ29070.1 hypothetical protein [Desulfobacteraceae bacterium]
MKRLYIFIEELCIGIVLKCDSGIKKKETTPPAPSGQKIFEDILPCKVVNKGIGKSGLNDMLPFS